MSSTGFRPQTLEPVGWSEGATTINFAGSYFNQASDSVVFALLSLSPGSAALSSGESLGIAFDPLLSASIGLGASGVLAMVVDADGVGATPEIGALLPGDITLYAVGIGFDLSAGGVEFGSVSDVMEIQL